MKFGVLFSPRFSLFAVSLLLTLPALGAINLNGTRFVYGQDDHEITVQVHNQGDYPVLLQNWIDDGHPEVAPEKLHVPFVLTPPLTRVEGQHGQTLRITYTGGNLPQDRESVFWLNVLEIPPANTQAQNQLLVAFRSRLKLFWRPTALKAGATEAPSKMEWQPDGQALVLKNPTPYYISLSGIRVTQAGRQRVVPAQMIAPSGTQRYDLSRAGVGPLKKNDIVEIIYINDYGAERVVKI